MGKRRNLGAYLDVMARQNALAVQEVYKMGGRKAMTLKTAMEEVGYNDELRAEGMAEEAVKIARNCIEQGIPLKTVATVTKLSPRKVRELAAETSR